jgi:Ca2+:H+ antiporter
VTPPNRSAGSRLRAILKAGNLLNLLLIFVPLAAVAEFAHFRPTAIFCFAAIAIIPLAGLMGHATEALAARLGAGIGGLLNATFGNAAELIIALVALYRGFYDVVKASLTGSIVGNVLLVLGLAFLVGGAKRDRQVFNRTAASAGALLLLLAALGLLVPTIFHAVAGLAVASGKVAADVEIIAEHRLSLLIALVLFVAYLASLLFSLRTHRAHYVGDGHDHGTPDRFGDDDSRSAGGGRAAAEAHAPAPMGRAVLTLLLATVGVAWMSELLVGAVAEASKALGLTEVFVGVIVVAIIGNAAEHSTAILVALKNKADLAVNIAVGSSVQIALFVAPVLVFASYLMPSGPMDLNFTAFEVFAVLAAVIVANTAAQEGESNWLEGALLLAVYAILALAFFFLPRGV